MSRLLLVRHGDILMNNPKRFWGQTDVDLNEVGIKKAELLCDRLASEKIGAIYSSNLKRCTVTANIIGARHKAEVVLCPELREINFGFIEGLTFSEISRIYPELGTVLSDWKAHPRFPGGETFDEMDQRILKFLPRLEKHGDGETLLIVAHNGTLRILLCHLLGIPVEHWLQLRIDPASISVLETYPQGAILNTLNDVSHLQPQTEET